MRFPHLWLIPYHVEEHETYYHSRPYLEHHRIWYMVGYELTWPFFEYIP